MKYWLQTFLFGKSVTYSSSNGRVNYINQLTDINGEKVIGYNKKFASEISVLGKPYASGTGVSIRLGTGSTVKTTADTYCLENDVTDTFTLDTINSSVDFPNDNTRLLLTASFTNDTNEDINVNEIGFEYNNNDYASSTLLNNKVLLDRKSVADGNFTPVTIGAGESKIFVYAIEL
jgi:hypothetical protein